MSCGHWPVRTIERHEYFRIVIEHLYRTAIDGPGAVGCRVCMYVRVWISRIKRIEE